MFESIKAAVTARQAAEHFGMEVSRSGMAICPFHEDRTPSLKLDQRYYCFGCGANGDAINFTARLFGISNYSAAQKLAEEFGIHSGSHTTENTQKKPAEPLRHLEQRCLFALVAYERLLQFWKKHYAPRSMGDPFHEKFVEACHQSSFVAHLIDEMMGADPRRRKQAVELLLEDDHLHCLQDYVLQNQEEEMKMNKTNISNEVPEHERCCT